MLSEITSTWQHALSELRAKLGHDEVERWLSDAKILSLGPETATLAVPSRLHLEWIRENYLDAIRSILGVPHCELEHHPSGPPALAEEPKGLPDADAPPVEACLVVKRKEPVRDAAGADEIPAPPLILNSDYCFENYVVGPCNRFAHAAARGVADRPAAAFNPFFLHGSVGLGKTHLLQGIAHQLLGDQPDQKIVLLSCEEFVNHFIGALQHGNLNSFRNRYRNADVLVVDDIHLLANKARTQEEFFHTFNTLHNARKQIVLSSDSSPEDIPQLQERLVSRFKWGLVAEIEPPCFETRVAILQAKAERMGMEVPRDVARYIAEHIENNVRELEGSLTKLTAMASLFGRAVDVGLARQVLSATFSNQNRAVRMDDVLDVICRHFAVRISDLQSKRRTQSIVFPRQIAMFLARQLTPLSLGEIGGHFGGRDHSTVLYAIERMEKRRRVDSEFGVTLTDLERQIRHLALEQK
ncbi:MAG: chromosomal replication initiator protein DnaA [Planctomycetes bacterium]|nr:chromosomal replication initiator protein DnaA [Planctomycetota bacterium]MBL7008397.1 chromosomal replication initiator protein DnaA [Planctomycetota bacterium]